MSSQPQRLQWGYKVLYAVPALALSAAGFFNATFQTKFYVDDLKMGPAGFGMVSAVVRGELQVCLLSFVNNSAIMTLICSSRYASCTPIWMDDG